EALGGGCALNQVEAAVPDGPWNTDGIGFHCVALFSRSSCRFVAHGTRHFAEFAFRVGEGDLLLGATVVTFLPGSSSPYFARLPISGAIGEQRSLLRFNRAVRALFAALLYLHSWNQTAVDAREHHGGLRLLHILTGPFRLLNPALNQLKIAVGIRIRSGAYYLRVTAGQNVLFFFDYLHQCSRPIGIATERAGGGSHGGSVHLHRFLFDVLVRFEKSVGPAALDRLLVQGAIAALGVAFDGAYGIRIFAVRVGGGRPGLVRFVGLGIGSLRPKRETGTRICRDREQHELAQTHRTGRAITTIVTSTVNAGRSPMSIPFGDICGWHRFASSVPSST